MAERRFTSVDDYIAAQPERRRAALDSVRATIRSAVPHATEGISYDMPTYTVDDNVILRFAAWKNHYSLYGATKAVVEAFHDDLRQYTVQKGTINVPFAVPVPAALIERIAAFRAKNLSG